MQSEYLTLRYAYFSTPLLYYFIFSSNMHFRIALNQFIY